MSIKIDKLKSKIPALPNPRFEPIIELVSNREAIVEGCCGIVEYTDSSATLNCRIFQISFNGFDICLKTLTGDSVCVTGNFTDISFSAL